MDDFPVFGHLLHWIHFSPVPYETTLVCWQYRCWLYCPLWHRFGMGIWIILFNIAARRA